MYSGTAEYTAAIVVLVGDGDGREEGGLPPIAYSPNLVLFTVVEKWNVARGFDGGWKDVGTVSD